MAKKNPLVQHARATALLNRMLDDPELVSGVQALPPPALARVVEHLGVEDAGELVAMATPSQLLHLFDESVWASSGPGEDEVLDTDNLRTWLEVLLEAGEEVAADKLADLPEELLAHALHELVLVVDLDALALSLAGRPEAMDRADRALEGSLQIEIEGYRILARRHDGWDAIATVLTSLDSRHSHLSARLLERCADAAASQIEDHGGLYEVLSAEEMLAEDAAAEREERRAREGHVPPSQARAFLGLAEKTAAKSVVADDRPDPVTRAYFRELDPQPVVRAPVANSDLRRILVESDAASGTTRQPLLASGERAFQRALVALSDRDPELHTRRLEELAFLLNVVLVGCTVDDRRPRAWEAAQIVLDACDRGLAELARVRGEAPETIVTRHGADALFRVGYPPDD